MMHPPRSAARSRALPPKVQGGFTLIELFIVIALVSVLATLATPYFKDMVGRGRLNSATRDVMGYIKVARMMAIARSAFTRVVVVEVDGAPTSGVDNKGMLRVEQYVGDNLGNFRWVVVSDPLTRSSVTLPTDTCQVSSGPSGNLGEYCVDFKLRYPASVSIAWIDDVGTALSARSTAQPMLEFGPDGFITNSILDFRQGNEKQEIQMVLTSKRSNGQLESRVIRVDRAGNVSFTPYRGAGVPST